VVCQAIGLKVGTTSSDYCLTWGGDKETLARSLHRIQKVSSEILGTIMPAGIPRHHGLRANAKPPRARMKRDSGSGIRATHASELAYGFIP